MRDLSHSGCVVRCCCRSWSCEPHQRTCDRVVSRELFAVARGGGRFVEETAADLLPRRRFAVGGTLPTKVVSRDELDRIAQWHDPPEERS